MFRDRVKETTAYKVLNKTIQSIIKTRNNFNHLEHGYNVAKHKGFERFDNEHNHAWFNKNIIEELIKNDKNEL